MIDTIVDSQNRVQKTFHQRVLVFGPIAASDRSNIGFGAFEVFDVCVDVGSLRAAWRLSRTEGIAKDCGLEDF